MRAVRLFLYFVVGLMFGGYAVLSRADSIPATNNNPCPSTGVTYIYNGTNYCAASEICTSSGLLFWSFSGGKAQCKDSATGDYSYRTYTVKSGSFYTCPTGQNWTLTNTICTRPDCAYDEERDANGVCIPKCTDEQERVNGVCVPKCAPTEIRREDGVCRPNCWGAQFYDEASNTCRCTTQLSQTSSWTVTAANAKAGKLDPPSCVNGCEQGPDPILGFIGSFCPGGLVSMVTGGSTTCYGKIVQTGATCAPDVSAPAGSLMPVSVSPAPPGTGPTGTADPYSTTANNADPATCAAAGGNWGVFNGQGNCYTPTTADPMVTQKSDQSVATNSDGSKTTTTTTTTNTCTGAGACSSSSSTTSNTTNTFGGGSSTTIVNNSGSGTATGTVTKTSEGQYKINLPKDYQKDSTGLILNSMVSEIKDAFGRPSGDDALITGAKASDEAMGKLRDADKLFGDGVSGQSLPGVDDKVSLWEQTMREGWWEPISIAGCSPFSHTFNFFSTSYTWTLDHCPTAAKISEIGAYCMWILLLFSGFRMLTTPRGEM